MNGASETTVISLTVIADTAGTAMATLANGTEKGSMAQVVVISVSGSLCPIAEIMLKIGEDEFGCIT